jgi:hypothetical protein
LKVDFGELKTTEHKKILRYYISHKGSKLLKKNPDGRVIQVESGKYLQTIMNQYEKKDFDDYGINYKYYLDKIYSEIQAIDDSTIGEKQLELF